MKNKVIIVTGNQGEGKTTFIRNIILDLKKEEFKIGGLIAPGYWKNNTREKFELQNIKSNKVIIYCQIEPKKGWDKIRKFYINPLGQLFGEQALDPDFLKSSDIIIIDEIGPFELEGKGWASSLTKILKNLKTPLIIVVRKSLLENVIDHWNIINPSVVEISNTKPEEFISILKEK